MRYAVLVVFVAMLLVGCQACQRTAPQTEVPHGYIFTGAVMADSVSVAGAIVQADVSVLGESRLYEAYTEEDGSYEIGAEGNETAEAKLRAGIFPGPQWSPWDYGIVQPGETVVDTFWF
jgi:hypothetical protein